MTESVMGTLTVIVGCMFAEKTTELLRVYRRATRAGKRCLLIKPKIDTRYSEGEIVSHNQDKAHAYVCEQASELLGMIKDYDYMLFDEGQFISDLPEVCEQLLQSGLKVYVAALRSDFRREPFPVVSRLLARANGGIIWATAVCVECGRDATERLLLTSELSEGIGPIGGAEAYAAVCLTCYSRINNRDVKETKN